jgi:type II secretory pathway pseudopilin PulG
MLMQKGFTLIELLIVLVILMLGGKLVYEIFF